MKRTMATLIATAATLTLSAPMAQAYAPEPEVAQYYAPVAVTQAPANTHQNAPQQRSESPAQVEAPKSPVAPAKSGITGTAASYLGIPYVWGGTTPAGFDCSGFTQFVFAANGINIPRTSQAQQAAATPVSNPVPGDLVFFGYPAYHVGIYAGDGMMYDSPRPGKATSLRAIWTNDVTFGRF